VSSCFRCVKLRAAEESKKKLTPQSKPSKIAAIGEALQIGRDHKIVAVHQQMYYANAVKQAAMASTAVVTQDFTSFALGPNVGASRPDRDDAKIRALIFVLETGDKIHHYRIFLCTGPESESSDYYFVRAAWFHLLVDGQPSCVVDADIRKARLIDVWSDGCSGQFKSR
jgi:hypothetical protein